MKKQLPKNMYVWRHDLGGGYWSDKRPKHEARIYIDSGVTINPVPIAIKRRWSEYQRNIKKKRYTRKDLGL